MKAFRETLAAVGLLSAIFLVVFNYRELPQRIPTHFDASGVANGWGDKSSLWVLVGIACFLYLLLTLVRFLPPNSMNIPVSQEKRAAAIPLALAMIGWLKFETMCIVAFILWSTVAVAQGQRQGLSAWFLPVTLVRLRNNYLLHPANEEPQRN